MDKLEEIKEYNPMHLSDAERAEHFERYCAELLVEIKTLRQAAHADQVVIQRLRGEIEVLTRERNEAANGWTESIETSGQLAGDLVVITLERDALQAKLARANHLAVSLTERVMR